jgi:uncharacterized protein (DUF1800 family)
MEVRRVPKDTPGVAATHGPDPLAPPSVKGWDGGPAWINTSTMLARFNYVNRIVKTSPPAATAPAPAAMAPAVMAPAAPASARRRSTSPPMRR